MAIMKLQKEVQPVIFPKISTEAVPVLVPCVKGEPCDGSRNFRRITHSPGSWGTDRQKIRELAQSDIDRAEEILGDDYPFLIGLLNLRQGLETNDEILTARGYKRVGESDATAEFMAQTPSWAGVRFPLFASEKLEPVRLVMWFSPRRKQFLPAFDCPDLKTGIQVHCLITIRSCPHCAKLFVPRAANVFYCCPAHRDAYRVSRARWRKENTPKKGAKKHGKR